MNIFIGDVFYNAANLGAFFDKDNLKRFYSFFMSSLELCILRERERVIILKFTPPPVYSYHVCTPNKSIYITFNFYILLLYKDVKTDMILQKMFHIIVRVYLHSLVD